MFSNEGTRCSSRAGGDDNFFEGFDVFATEGTKLTDVSPLAQRYDPERYIINCESFEIR